MLRCATHRDTCLEHAVGGALAAMDPGPVHFLVPYHLPIQLVGQQINGGVKVRVTRFAVDVFPGEVHGDLGGLVQFLDTQHDVDFVDMVKVSPGPAKFLIDVVPDGVGDFEVMPFDRQMHGEPPFRVSFVD